jgi:AsmA protein
MRVIKILAIAAGGLVTLLVIALLAVWMFVDPNDYKDRITAAVQESTGRKLALPGKLQLSVFPWLAVQTGEASLGNPKGFGDEPFMTLKRASLRVRLLPLLHKELEIGRVEIDGLDLRLKQNAAGKGNWEDWSAEAEAQTTEAEGGGLADGLTLAGIAIANSRIAFEDLVAQNLNMRIGRVAPGAPIPVDFKLELQTEPNAEAMPLAATFRLTMDMERQRYSLAELKLEGSVQPEGAPRSLGWEFNSPAMELNLTAQTLTETAFSAAVGTAKLSGSIAGSKLIDAPALTGHFELEELAPRELMQQFGITPPVTRDAAALARFAALGQFAWQNKVARSDDLKLRLDDSRLTGRFAYEMASSGMDFALTLDKIDLDRYQPPPVEKTKAASEPIELPVDFLKPLYAKGTFNVGEIKIGGAKLTQFSAGVQVKDRIAQFAPLKAQLYGGQYAGDIRLDMRSAVPRLSMNETLSNIDMAALMQDFADTQRLSGRGTLTAQMTGSGRNGDALLKTLNGKISTTLANGAVEGIDIWYAIAQAQSLIQKRALAGGTNARRTAFDTFHASADVVNGVATTKDLAIASQLLRITGEGSSNLVTQALDYSVTATVLKAPPGADDGVAQLARASIPVKITGTFADPKVRPDLAGMAKERVKQEVEEKVKEKVKDKLKGLFGR